MFGRTLSRFENAYCFGRRFLFAQNRCLKRILTFHGGRPPSERCQNFPSAPAPNLLLSCCLLTRGAGEQQGRGWESAWNGHLRGGAKGNIVQLNSMERAIISKRPAFSPCVRGEDIGKLSPIFEQIRGLKTCFSPREKVTDVGGTGEFSERGAYRAVAALHFVLKCQSGYII